MQGARTLFLLGMGFVAGVALAAMIYTQVAPRTDETAVRAIVDDMLVARADMANPTAPDAASLNLLIESYLLENPAILEQMSVALEAEALAAEREAARVAIAAMHDQIYTAPGQVVVGNPDGDVTLVEMFDYNCSFCRRALADLAEVIDTDPNLKVILKEFPILSKESVDAARVAVAVAQTPVSYWEYHQAVFAGRGQITGETALAAAEALGLDRTELEIAMLGDNVSQTIQDSYEIAQALNIGGTPTFIIGDEILPGAVGADELRLRIENMRTCGKTLCEG